jgi:hypothetical protein
MVVEFASHETIVAASSQQIETLRVEPFR